MIKLKLVSALREEKREKNMQIALKRIGFTAETEFSKAAF